MEMKPGVLAHSRLYTESSKCHRLTVSSKAPRKRPDGGGGGSYTESVHVLYNSDKKYDS